MAARVMTARDVTRTRESLGMDKTEFAELLRVSQPAIVRWEKGDRPVSEAMSEYIRLKVAEYRQTGSRQLATA
jgi:DNA-binding transcriptional regulator YiaG